MSEAKGCLLWAVFWLVMCWPAWSPTLRRARRRVSRNTTIEEHRAWLVGAPKADDIFDGTQWEKNEVYPEVFEETDTEIGDDI